MRQGMWGYVQQDRYHQYDLEDQGDRWGQGDR